ncbi:hypothetical protein EVG20_g3247 [Dentipellis fragilis]|uniref:Uncharacterized protein n=1 Tax=Dentipellis fragilis TaxID=205917 RepID=A0A4Y9Z3Q3_9AGAM|nr:hypothetical protein EVG20_g3247 [Dentipellis fragilis]
MHHPLAVYENPFVTATSRGTIGDIYSLSHQLSKVDAPKPLSLLRHILGIGRADSDPWFQVVRMWTEIGEVCESESFGVHAGFPVPETLPQGHGFTSDTGGTRRLSLNGPGPLSSKGGPSDPPVPMMPVVDAVLPLPSPLHLRLPVLTRLSFNEQGRITHHRDLWDVRDLVGLFPGAALAQWIGTRLAARGLSVASRLGAWVVRSLLHCHLVIGISREGIAEIGTCRSHMPAGVCGELCISTLYWHPGDASPRRRPLLCYTERRIRTQHPGSSHRVRCRSIAPAPSQLSVGVICIRRRDPCGMHRPCQGCRGEDAVANGHCQASPDGCAHGIQIMADVEPRAGVRLLGAVEGNAQTPKAIQTWGRTSSAEGNPVREPQNLHHPGVPLRALEPTAPPSRAAPVVLSLPVQTQYLNSASARHADVSPRSRIRSCVFIVGERSTAAGTRAMYVCIAFYVCASAAALSAALRCTASDSAAYPWAIMETARATVAPALPLTRAYHVLPF